MHYTHTCRAICVGADLVSELPKGTVKEKCLAWYMGYTAHVVTDMCIHPVVELKVGPYTGNETPHRRCEMHQDAYIFRRIGAGMPQVANHIRTTILRCGSPEDPHRLDSDIKKLWEQLLKTVHPEAFGDDPPDLDKWHRRCYMILEKILPTSSRFVGFARHACDDAGLLYPTPDELATGEYIENLNAPGQKRMHYDAIFDFAIDRVQQVWLDVTRYALRRRDLLAFRDEEWDLDTGRNKSDTDNRLVFWGVA
jgi:hypothetical protein